MEKFRLGKRNKVLVLVIAFLLANIPVKASASPLDDTVTIATPNGLTTLNPYSVNAFLGSLNRDIRTLTAMSFTNWGKDLNQVQNSQFGSYTVLSTSPLTVRFTVRNGIQWSDGTPITAVDLLFFHLVSSSAYAKSAGLETGPSRTFNSRNYGDRYDQALVQTPTISADKQSLTLVYGQAFPDWEMFTPSPFPVHALVLIANGSSGLQNLAQSVAAKSMFESAFQNRNTALLKKYAETLDAFYNIKEVNEKTNPLLLVANGPYQLDFADSKVVRLKKNVNYNSGPSLSGIDSIQYRIIPDGTELQAAIAKGEVDIAEGVVTKDAVDFLRSIKQNRFISFDSAAYEHLDLRVGPGPDGGTYNGPFAGNSAKARDLRTAFLLAFPREEILNKVIKPVAPHAILPTSLLLSDSEKGYDEVSLQSGFLSRYSQDDISRQKTALKIVKNYFPTATSSNPMVDVRILYGANNARRAAVIALAKAALAQAGFNLIPDVQSNWAPQLRTSMHDAYIFAWVHNIGSQISGLAYQSDSGNNYLGYSNLIVDQNSKLLNSSYLNPQQKINARSQIEEQLVMDAISIPLYRNPEHFSVNSRLIGFKPSLKPTVSREGYLWNFWEWKKGDEATIDELAELTDDANFLYDALLGQSEGTDELNFRIQDDLDGRSFTSVINLSSELFTVKRKLIRFEQELQELEESRRSMCEVINNNKTITDLLIQVKMLSMAFMMPQ
jgi:peptide/nickel transport system substrate-binding protein